MHNFELEFCNQTGSLRLEMGLSECEGTENREQIQQEILVFGNVAKNMLEPCFQEHRAVQAG